MPDSKEINVVVISEAAIGLAKSPMLFTWRSSDAVDGDPLICIDVTDHLKNDGLASKDDILDVIVPCISVDMSLGSFNKNARNIDAAYHQALLAGIETRTDEPGSVTDISFAYSLQCSLNVEYRFIGTTKMDDSDCICHVHALHTSGSLRPSEVSLTGVKYSHHTYVDLSGLRKSPVQGNRCIGVEAKIYGYLTKLTNDAQQQL